MRENCIRLLWEIYSPNKSILFYSFEILGFQEVINIRIRVVTDDYIIKKVRLHGATGVIRHQWEHEKYNIIPIPLTEEVNKVDDDIILNSNVIFHKSVSSNSRIFIPSDYILADALIVPSDMSEIYISSEYNNYFIKKPFDAIEKARIDIHKSMGMNVYSCFIPLTPFNAEGETRVNEVILRNTIENPRYSMITLPLWYKDYNVVFFEDDYYEF